MARKRTKRQTTQRSESFWRRALQRWSRSGLSGAAFCRREGLPSATFYLWRRRLGEAVREPTASLLPVELVTTGSAVLPADEGFSGYQVQLSGGRVLRIPPDFDDEALRRLLLVLEHQSC